jgi:hypothetical protein
MKNSSPKGGLGLEMAKKFFDYEQGIKKRQEKSKAKKLAKTKS